MPSLDLLKALIAKSLAVFSASATISTHPLPILNGLVFAKGFAHKQSDEMRTPSPCRIRKPSLPLDGVTTVHARSHEYQDWSEQSWGTLTAHSEPVHSLVDVIDGKREERSEISHCIGEPLRHILRLLNKRASSGERHKNLAHRRGVDQARHRRNGQGYMLAYGPSDAADEVVGDVGGNLAISGAGHLHGFRSVHRQKQRPYKLTANASVIKELPSAHDLVVCLQYVAESHAVPVGPQSFDDLNDVLA